MDQRLALASSCGSTTIVGSGSGSGLRLGLGLPAVQPRRLHGAPRLRQPLRKPSPSRHRPPRPPSTSHHCHSLRRRPSSPPYRRPSRRTRANPSPRPSTTARPLHPRGPPLFASSPPPPPPPSPSHPPWPSRASRARRRSAPRDDVARRRRPASAETRTRRRARRRTAPPPPRWNPRRPPTRRPSSAPTRRPPRLSPPGRGRTAGSTNAGIPTGVSKLGLGSKGCVRGCRSSRAGQRNTAATAPFDCARRTSRGACRTMATCASQSPSFARNTATPPLIAGGGLGFMALAGAGGWPAAR